MLYRLSTVYRAENSTSRRQVLRQLIAHKHHDVIRDQVERQIQSEELDGVAYAHVAYAYGHLDISHHAFFEGLKKYIPLHIHAFHLKSISMVAWAFAKIGISSSSSTCSDRDSSSASLSSLSLSSTFQIMSEVVIDQMKIAHCQVISHIAWAFSTLEIPAPKMFKAIADECVSTRERLEKFSEQEMCVLAWSFGRQHYHHAQLFARIAEIACKQIRRYTPQHLQMLFLGFAELGIRDESLFELFANESVVKIAAFSGVCDCVILFFTAAAVVFFEHSSKLDNVRLGVHVREIVESKIDGGTGKTMSRTFV